MQRNKVVKEKQSSVVFQEQTGRYERRCWRNTFELLHKMLKSDIRPLFNGYVVVYMLAIVMDVPRQPAVSALWFLSEMQLHRMKPE